MAPNPKSISLKKYFEALRKADIEYAKARFDAQENAIQLAKESAEKAAIRSIVVAGVSLLTALISFASAYLMKG